MADFFQWLSGGSTSSIVFIAAVIILVVGLVLIYLTAFLQGREVSFWPPKIGQKPASKLSIKEKTGKADKSLDSKRGDIERVEAPILAKLLLNNDLGKGITIGGFMENTPLGVVASDWARFPSEPGDGWVRSGWLYRFKPTADWSGTSTHTFLGDRRVSHAIAFFKIHLGDNGKGYIHIMDAANPVHTIWLETNTNFRREEKFCWDQDPSIHKIALWQFTWQSSPQTAG